MSASPRLVSLINRAVDTDGRRAAWLADQAGYHAVVLSGIRTGDRPPMDLGRVRKLVDVCGGTADDYVAVVDELTNFDVARRAEKPGAGGAA